MISPPPDKSTFGSETTGSLAALVQEAQNGSQEAFQSLYDRYRAPLLKVIRSVIQPRIRQLYDSEDFLCETFITIFTNYFTDEVLRSPEVFWSYVKKIAENKVRDANRKLLISKRRNINRNVPLETLHNDDCAHRLWAKDISPFEAAILKELVEERLRTLVGKLPKPMRAIVRLLLAGNNAGEIARCLRTEPKRVYRAMEWLKKAIRD